MRIIFLLQNNLSNISRTFFIIYKYKILFSFLFLFIIDIIYVLIEYITYNFWFFVGGLTKIIIVFSLFI